FSVLQRSARTRVTGAVPRAQRQVTPLEWGRPAQPERLLARMGTLPEPRRRQGRWHPLPALVGRRRLAARHGEPSVRAMGWWRGARWDALWAPLGCWPPPGPPPLPTVWGRLARLDAAAPPCPLGGAGARRRRP